jgi:hypothetical protein
LISDLLDAVAEIDRAARTGSGRSVDVVSVTMR